MDKRPFGTAEKYFFTAFMLILGAGGIVIAGGIIYGIATNLKESALFAAGLAVFALIVHLVVRFTNWDDDEDGETDEEFIERMVRK